MLCFFDTVLLGSVVPIRVFLCVLKFTSIAQLETAGLRLTQSMQLRGATLFGRAPKTHNLFHSLHQAYFYVNFAGVQVQYLVGVLVETMALTRVSARVLGFNLSLSFHECSIHKFHSTTLLYFLAVVYFPGIQINVYWHCSVSGVRVVVWLLCVKGASCMYCTIYTRKRVKNTFW
jgi:hypothetical protein